MPRSASASERGIHMGLPRKMENFQRHNHTGDVYRSEALLRLAVICVDATSLMAPSGG